MRPAPPSRRRTTIKRRSRDEERGNRSRRTTIKRRSRDEERGKPIPPHDDQAAQPR